MKAKSEALASVHEAIADLHGLGLVDKTTMRRFDELCLAAVPSYSPDEIRALRERLNISQAVLASVINASPNSIQKWERGAKRPSGTALKLLNLLDRRGLESVM
ncbi:MAG: DNA-binding transcriptional regulator [Candidatus Adiutrix sp.]|jgi:putative transcriptional regulator|nr:DNA-binding transcriptional regulator [Candidatus Adiutrix sp.]